MKKLVIILIILALILITFFPKQNLTSESPEKDNAEPTLTQVPVDEYVQPKMKTFATKKLKKLTLANKQCRNRNESLNSTNQGLSINQEIVKALEQEIGQGKTDRELLAYSHQYEVFYKRYDNLLLEAKINIKKAKYNFTSSLDILNDWKGLSVIEGFSTSEIPNVVQKLKNIEASNVNFIWDLNLAEDITKADVYALLDNKDNFTTYLESPLSIAGSSVISPAILFVLTATTLDIDEYKQAISLHSFTVNEVAIAIKNDMPIEYLKLLFEQTKTPEDMPLFVHGAHNSYYNLADLAAANFNTAFLKFLDEFGVTPTNEPGIITGMDIALLNLPSGAKAYKKLKVFPNKYLNTLTYLINKGYRAHGFIDDWEETTTFFRAPNRRLFQISNDLEPRLLELLYRIELIDIHHNIEQIPPDQSLVSKAIAHMTIWREALSNKAKSCDAIRKALLAEEGFLETNEARKVIQRIRKDNQNIPERLHEIDPVLVELWRDLNSFSHRNLSSNQESKFIDLLVENQYQRAFDYSVLNPLTLRETDTLLALLLRNVDDLLPIWNARVSPQPPSSLIAFENLPIDKWELLLNEGFDFSIRDKFDNDLFISAVLNSSKAVKLLIDNGLIADSGKLGLDVLDILLDESYGQGRLNSDISEIMKMFSKFEPSHYARVARLQKYFPEEYKKLISLNKDLIPSEGTKINQFRHGNYY